MRKPIKITIFLIDKKDEEEEKRNRNKKEEAYIDE